MKAIDNYNKSIRDLVKQFFLRACKEEWTEVEDTDFENFVEIMDYEWIHNWPIYFWDMYFWIDDIATAELHQIPFKIFEKYYRLCLENDWRPWINLFNYWRKSKDPVEYEKQEKENLKRLEENGKKFKEYLEDVWEN